MFGDMSIVELFLASPTMLVLLACSVVTLAFVVERLLYFKSTGVDTRGFMRDIAPKLSSGDRDAALQLCRRRKSAVAHVLEQGLTHLHLGRAELHQRMNTAIEVEQVEMERNLNVLATMSNIAPLLGLFGTVVGIIRAFADIAKTGSGGSAVVAMGVAEALLTTAAGIVIAVMATVFFNGFVRRIRTRTVEMEDAREEFFSLLAQREVVAAPAQSPSSSPGITRRVPRQEPAPAGFLS